MSIKDSDETAMILTGASGGATVTKALVKAALAVSGTLCMGRMASKAQMEELESRLAVCREKRFDRAIGELSRASLKEIAETNEMIKRYEREELLEGASLEYAGRILKRQCEALEDSIARFSRRSM